MRMSKLAVMVQALKEEVESQAVFDQTAADSVRVRVRELAERVEKMSGAHDEPMTDQLTRIAAEFEAEHPKTARLLERMADTLSKLGV